MGLGQSVLTAGDGGGTSREQERLRVGTGSGAEGMVGEQTPIEIGSFDGLTLRGRSWRSKTRRGVLSISHGFGEHGGTYGEIARTLVDALGIDVVAFDFRGHGRSDGPRGYVRKYEDLAGDLHRVTAWLEREYSDVPRFLLGHSNGGQVVLRVALERPGSIRGYILSNPALKIALPVPRATLVLGRFLLACFPWVTIQGKVQTELLTHDPERRSTLRADPLRHTRMSAPLFFGMVEGGRMLHRRAAEMTEPVLLILSGEDPVIDPLFTRQAYDRFSSTDKTLLYYPRMFHEPFNEAGRDGVYEDMIRWLEPRL